MVVARIDPPMISKALEFDATETAMESGGMGPRAGPPLVCYSMN
jgi:hypothetical protein